MKLFLLIAIFTLSVLWLTGCSTIGSIAKYRNDYCSKTTDSFTKAVAIASIRSVVPGYPAAGICTGYEEVWYGNGFYGSSK